MISHSKATTNNCSHQLPPSKEKINQLKEILTPLECPACNGSLETNTIKGKWPPENPTSEEILSLFRDTKGNFTIEFDPENDSKFYISEIGGEYCVETIHHTRPDQSYSVDNLPKLITSIPNRLRDTDSTTLSGHLEDYQNGL